MTWALITGATSGIGKATAYRLAKEKINLILTGRRQSRLDEIRQDLILQYGIDCQTLCFDLSDLAATEAVLKLHCDQLAQVDILINNAGLALGVAPVDEMKFADLQKMIDVNVSALLYLSHFFIPSFKAKKQGHIINIGSVAGRWTYPGGTTYCATKFAVRALSEGLRLDLQGFNIRVSNIEPGMVETEFSEVRLGDRELAKKVYDHMTPLQAEDIAESINWVIQAPKHVNIQEIVIYPTDQAAIGQVFRRQKT